MEPILDINDSTLALWRGEQLELESPGYALLENDSYRFGAPARAEARLHPRQINHRYWSQLDLEPITPPFGPARHTADMVHAHLMDIYENAGRPEKLLLAAPGNLQHDQLALLLGIAASCPFEVAGLVDRAVAATSQYEVAPYNWHIELQLNQVLLTGMKLDGDELVRDTTVPIPGSGWLAIQEALAKAIADAFIRQTRFDPRRAAKTEQALYNSMADILKRLQTSAETNIELDGRQARIERSALAQACDPHYQRISRAANTLDAGVFLSASLSALPELDQQLSAAVQCDAAAMSRAVAKNLDAVLADANGVHFITRLKAAGTKAAVQQPDAAVTAAPESPPPAEKIVPSRCQIEFDGDALTIEPLPEAIVTVNGAALTEQTSLRDGDVIGSAGGVKWRLSAVADSEDHGT